MFDPVNGLEKLRPKRLRRDLLTSLNFVMWELHKLGGIEMIIGVGTGAVVAGLLGRPRFVEMALTSKVLRPGDVSHMHKTWHSIRVIVLWSSTGGSLPPSRGRTPNSR